MTDNTDDLIENSSLSSQTVHEPTDDPLCLSRRDQPLCLWQEEMDRKEKMTAGLNQTVSELQLVLQGVSRKLSKEAVRPQGPLKLQIGATGRTGRPYACVRVSLQEADLPKVK